jgi:two-component system, OmpR family, sensor kinase
MNRKWLLALLLASLIVVSGVAIMARTLNNGLILTMPVGDAILLVAVVIGSVVVVGIEIWSLRRNQKRLFAEQRQLKETMMHQTGAIRQQEGIIASQTNTIREQTGTIDEQQEFRRALNHELRNPMTALSIGLERLSGECGTTTVTHLKADVERVSSLLETVSALARLETDPSEFGLVKLDEVMRQAVEIIEATPGATDRKLAVDLPPGPFPLPAIQGNDDLLFIALSNLLGNAVKFTPESGEVVIRAFDDNGMVVVQVSDNGLGICQDDLDKVWKPFFRGQIARDCKIPGSGLGLYQVYKIVTRHGGQVSIRSKVGEGTVVTIRLPAVDITNP